MPKLSNLTKILTRCNVGSINLQSPKMNLHFLPTISLVSFTPKTSHCFINEATHKSRPILKRVNSEAPNELSTEFLSPDSLGPTKPCFCGRRHFIEAATLGTTLFPVQPSNAANSHSDYTVMPSLSLTQITENGKFCTLSSNFGQKWSFWWHNLKMFTFFVGFA